MTEVTSYAPGTPSWVDLMSSDPQDARRFYGALFGWDFEIGPEETGHYTLCRVRGHNVAGLGGEPAPEGIPTAWTTYLATEDVDAAVQRVTDAGGSIVMAPMDVMDQGRMAIATDPTGAVFGMWQAGAHVGASLVNEPGAIVWNELATRDLAAAQAFYTAVFGHGWEVSSGEGGPPYTTFAVEGRMAGGALEMTGDWPAETPPHWTPYFAVADTDAVASSAQRLGGGLAAPPADSPYGRMAALSDPQGGAFSVIATADPASP